MPIRPRLAGCRFDDLSQELFDAARVDVDDVTGQQPVCLAMDSFGGFSIGGFDQTKGGMARWIEPICNVADTVLLSA